MSLINDALRRAREAQNVAPPTDTPVPHLRPVEEGEVVRQSLDLMVLATLGIVALLLLLLFWQWAHRKAQAGPTTSQTQTALPATTLAAAPAPAPPASLSMAKSAAATQPDVTPATTTSTAPVAQAAVLPAPAPATASASPLGSGDHPAAGPEIVSPTPAAATTEAPATKLAPLRLQGIMFHPTRPSAMISGKLLFVGDKVGEFRVLAISQDSATLVGGGQTNVLTLAQ